MLDGANGQLRNAAGLEREGFGRRAHELFIIALAGAHYDVEQRSGRTCWVGIDEFKRVAGRALTRSGRQLASDFAELERCGLILRRSHPEIAAPGHADRRSRMIWLTPKGVEAYRALLSLSFADMIAGALQKCDERPPETPTARAVLKPIAASAAALFVVSSAYLTLSAPEPPPGPRPRIQQPANSVAIGDSPVTLVTYAGHGVSADRAKERDHRAGGLSAPEPNARFVASAEALDADLAILKLIDRTADGPEFPGDPLVDPVLPLLIADPPKRARLHFTQGQVRRFAIAAQAPCIRVRLEPARAIAPAFEPNERPDPPARNAPKARRLGEAVFSTERGATIIAVRSASDRRLWIDVAPHDCAAAHGAAPEKRP
ncbi:MAG: hypothetical protein AAGM38_08175 [Pseudomonadota bacterium]